MSAGFIKWPFAVAKLDRPLAAARDDGQFTHACDADFARRANLSHLVALAPSGKSNASSRASRLDEEGRYGRSSRNVRRGAMDAAASARKERSQGDLIVSGGWRADERR
jgi:hypothetical protein